MCEETEDRSGEEKAGVFFTCTLPGVVNVHNCVQEKKKKKRHHRKHHSDAEDKDSSSGSSIQC